eukprot:13740_1
MQIVILIENTDTPVQMYPTHLKNNKHQFLYNIPPIQDDNNTDNIHIEIPTTTTSFQPSLSSNNASKSTSTITTSTKSTSTITIDFYNESISTTKFIRNN